MTVTAVRKDADALTMTIDTEFAAPPARVWELWQDPRQLERWWGPPMYPATFTAHDLRPGGIAAYHMTAPDGARYHGWWEVLEVDPPRRLIFLDGFANDDGSRNEQLPTTTSHVTLEAVGEGRTHMTLVSVFPSAEAMEQILAMGVEEGMVGALGQADAILAEERVG